MRKIKTTTIYFIITVFLAIGCKSTPKLETGNENDFGYEGWLSESTYQVVAKGSPSSDTKGFVRRRMESESNAVASAKNRFIKLCSGQEVAKATPSSDTSVVDVPAGLGDDIEGGKIILVSRESDDVAQVTFRVSATNLKEKCDKLSGKPKK